MFSVNKTSCDRRVLNRSDSEDERYYKTIVVEQSGRVEYAGIAQSSFLLPVNALSVIGSTLP